MQTTATTARVMLMKPLCFDMYTMQVSLDCAIAKEALVLEHWQQQCKVCACHSLLSLWAVLNDGHATDALPVISILATHLIATHSTAAAHANLHMRNARHACHLDALHLAAQ